MGPVAVRPWEGNPNPRPLVVNSSGRAEGVGAASTNADWSAGSAADEIDCPAWSEPAVAFVFLWDLFLAAVDALGGAPGMIRGCDFSSDGELIFEWEHKDYQPKTE